MTFESSDKFHQATGCKIGEVTQDSVVVWVRRTEFRDRNAEGVVAKGPVKSFTQQGVDTWKMEGSVPGAPGQVRVRYGAGDKLDQQTEWIDLSGDYDYTHQFFLTGLKPGTKYFYAIDTAAPSQGDSPDGKLDDPLTGSFMTAYPVDERRPLTFTVLTCMMYAHMDHPEGFNIFESMLDLQPQFVVEAGDCVYYDSEAPRATSVDLCRYHWNRMYGMPRHIEFHRYVPGYWQKDDHDTLANDCWPEMERASTFPLTYEEGSGVFSEQVPVGRSWYRTVRWGKALQIWMVEGRDFRSANDMEDGPKKTLLGEKQKQWLKDSIAASDADWRILMSPTCIVGPDRESKADNLSNDAFQHEGDEIRDWIRDNGHGNLFVLCGDRHWQHHSVDPRTGVIEFSCGPASDQHASGSPDFDPAFHKFHRVKGGFLSVSVEPQGDGSTITMRLHDVQGKVVHEFSPSATG